MHPKLFPLHSIRIRIFAALWLTALSFVSERSLAVSSVSLDESRSNVETEGHDCATLKGARTGIELRNRLSLRASVMNRGSDTYDIHHYHFNLALTNTSTAIAGDVMFRSTVTSPVMDTFWFELRSFMNIDSVQINGTRYLPTALSRLNDVVRVPLLSNLDAGMQVTCRVFYQGTPPSAGFFSGVSSDVSQTWGVNVTWTLSEPFSAPDWFPCKQDLWDKIDSVFFDGTSVSPNKVASTGLLIGVDTLTNNRFKYKWRSRIPMAFYLMAFSVTDYTEHLSWAHPTALVNDSVLIQHWIYNANNSSGTSCLNFNRNALNSTGAMIENFSDLFILYPFYTEKYGHMMAPLGGGMEHQTMSTMGSFGMDLISHELAHQWFGDMVTCANWNDIWLNEGWASYCEYLHRQYVISQTSANDWMSNSHNSARSATTGSVYVPASGVNNVSRIFSSPLTYKKGAAVLHMLRNEIGDDSLFFPAVREYLNTKRHSVSTTDEFRQIMEQRTAVPLQNFFQDWVYGEGHPTYTIQWNWLDSVLWLQMSQTVTAPTATPVFRNKLPLGLITSGPGQAPSLIQVEPALGLQRIRIPRQVANVTLDPSNAILKGTNSSIARLTTLGVGFEEVNFMNFNPYPNPSTGIVCVVLNLPADLILTDLSGRVMGKYEGHEGENLIDLNAYPGTYILEAVSPTGSRVSRRVVVR